ncbi:MAG: 50S ribosomal protein L30 [Spirochaetes bacterium]|nr:50S ribosomal protein L30 [Spirochaetota bacterium]MCK5266931.1 50S ribosomal protein L30 [Spirochaetota bacterium]
MAKKQKIEVKLVKSAIGSNKNQRGTLRSLGLRKLGRVRLHDKNDVIMGMVDKVSHLVVTKDV